MTAECSLCHVVDEPRGWVIIREGIVIERPRNWSRGEPVCIDCIYKVQTVQQYDW